MRRTLGLALGAALLLAACSAPAGTAPTQPAAVDASATSSPATRDTTSIGPGGASTAPATEGTATADGTTTHTIADGVTVEAPSTWFPVEYRGMLAPVYFPLWFFSSSRYSGACSTGKQNQACTEGGGWFPPDWVTPDDGVIVLWSESQFPWTSGPALAHLPGDITSINGHRARVWTGTATRACSHVASTEMDAYVVRYEHDNPGVRIDMKACFGEHAPDDVRAAVRAMLDSLTISND
jgi:hypothetical protein